MLEFLDDFRMRPNTTRGNNEVVFIVANADFAASASSYLDFCVHPGYHIRSHRCPLYSSVHHLKCVQLIFFLR